MRGNTRNWRGDEVKEIADRYNAGDGEAPVVVGHPKTDDPAYGWVKRLHYREDDGVLTADIGNLDPDFRLLVRDGRYKRISSAFDMGGDGVINLRHVGFLGAAKPAISGLKAVNFSGEAAMTYEFGGTPATANKPASLKAVLSSIHSYLADAGGSKVSPLWELTPTANREFANKGGKDNMPNSENTKPVDDPAGSETTEKQAAGEFAADKRGAAQGAALAKKVEQLDKAQAEFVAKRDLAEAESHVRELVRDGKLTPAQAAGLAEFIAAQPEDKTICFAAGGADGKEQKLSPRAYALKFLGALPAQVAYGEAAENTQNGIATDAEALARKVSAFVAEQKEQGIEVSYGDALRFVESNTEVNNG